MKQSQQDFINSAIYRDAVSQNIANSVMLISPDKYALDVYATNLASTLMCEGASKPCGVCPECIKIAHKNSVDVHFFPRTNKIINSSEIADILDICYQAPYASDKKILVLRDANLIDVNMQNKLLKTLEEPPQNTYFLLLVTEDNKVLPTIKSRCRKWHLPSIAPAEIMQELEALGICPAEQRQIVAYAGGNCSLAINYAQNKEFGELVRFTQDLLKNFRKSYQMVDFATKLYKMNDNFEEFLTILLKNCSDAVRVLAGQVVDNPTAFVLARDFSVDALCALVKNCGDFVEKRARNCNYNALVDSFLFMILEVRHKWPV